MIRNTLLFVALMLYGCAASTPYKPAATPEEQAWQLSVRAQKTADAAEATLTQGLNEKLISSEQAKQIHPAIDTIRAAYKSARTALLQDGNANSAITILRGADGALKILQDFLASRGKTVPAMNESEPWTKELQHA